jgi:thioredoxin-like negative regulator of GroEL
LEDEAKFSSGMAAYDAKDYEAALKIFQDVVGGDKDSAWQISSRRMEAESLIKLGRVKEALAILDSIGTPQSKVRVTIIRSN